LESRLMSSHQAAFFMRGRTSAWILRSFDAMLNRSADHVCRCGRCVPEKEFFMRATTIFLAACLLASGVFMSSVRAEEAPSPTTAERLLAGYEQIASLRCDLRREVQGPEDSLRWLSRIYYQRPDRLHAVNIEPLPRLIIADGTTMYQHNEGQPRGFRAPLADLDDVMLANLRKIPGTPMEHLFRLQGLPEKDAGHDAEADVRFFEYETDQVICVLSIDAQDRLTRLRLYTKQDRETPAVDISYRHQLEVLPGVWMAQLQVSEIRMGEIQTRETVRLSNLEINPELDASLFDASQYFPEAVEWVNRFEDL
jgi:hypothetical protein